MNLLHKYYSNFRQPEGLLGKYIVHRMNGKRHAALMQWAIEGYEIPSGALIADVGCGGGANVARLLALSPDCKVAGIDISPVSVNIASSVNREAIKQGRCKITGGNARLLPLIKDTVDLVTAFETVYYWAAFGECVDNIFRVLKPGGTCIIANETDGIDPEGAKWKKLINHMHIYTIDELKQYLAAAGFTDITARNDEQRHFICVTAHKP